MLTDILAHFLWSYQLKEYIIISKSWKLLLSNLKKELNRRNEELETHPETGISLEEARKIVYKKYGRV